MAALLLVVLFHRWLPETRWLLVHLVTLGLVTNSVLVWSQHFTDSLLKNRVPDDARGRQLARIGLLNAGTVLLVVGILTGWYVLVLVASRPKSPPPATALPCTAKSCASSWRS